jgi:hypothetical protein
MVQGGLALGWRLSRKPAPSVSLAGPVMLALLLGVPALALVVLSLNQDSRCDAPYEFVLHSPAVSRHVGKTRTVSHCEINTVAAAAGRPAHIEISFVVRSRSKTARVTVERIPSGANEFRYLIVGLD